MIIRFFFDGQITSILQVTQIQHFISAEFPRRDKMLSTKLMTPSPFQTLRLSAGEVLEPVCCKKQQKSS